MLQRCNTFCNASLCRSKASRFGHRLTCDSESLLSRPKHCWASSRLTFFALDTCICISFEITQANLKNEGANVKLETQWMVSNLFLQRGKQDIKAFLSNCNLVEHFFLVMSLITNAFGLLNKVGFNLTVSGRLSRPPSFFLANGNFPYSWTDARICLIVKRIL